MKKFIALTIACIMGLTVLSTIAYGGEGEEKGKKERENKPYAYGKVEVVREGEEVKEIYVTYKDKKVPIVLDDKGKELVALEGKIVKVTGERTESGAIAVKEFKEKEHAPKGKSAKKGAEAKEGDKEGDCKKCD